MNSILCACSNMDSLSQWRSLTDKLLIKGYMVQLVLLTDEDLKDPISPKKQELLSLIQSEKFDVHLLDDDTFNAFGSNDFHESIVITLNETEKEEELISDIEILILKK